MEKKRFEEWRERFFHTPDSTCFAYIADMMIDLRLYEKAKEILDKGLKIHPEYIPGLITLGRYYFVKDELEEAKDVFLKVVNYDFENMRAYNYLVKIYEKTGDRDSLYRTYETIAILDPYNKKTEEFFSGNLSSQKPFPTVAIAELYEAQGHYEEAINIYKEVLKRNPENEEIKGRIKKLLGKKDV